MMNRRIALALAVMILAGVLAACGGGTEPTSTTASAQTTAGSGAAATTAPAGPGGPIDTSGMKIFRLGHNTEFETADVQLTTADYTIPLNIFDRLVEIEPVGDGLTTLAPGLATEWTVSPDGLVYTFKLREGVQFHNGEIFKADDVLYTIERMCNPVTNAKSSDAFTAIKGAVAMLDGEADSVEGVKVLSDYEVEITLESAYAPFLANMATPAGSIYNRKATEEGGLEFGVNPAKTCGTGPYYLAEWVLNDHSLILAFDNYWGGRPKNDGVSFAVIPDADAYRMMFEAGELDELDLENARNQIPYFTQSPQWKDHVVYGNRLGTYYYHMNQNIEPFNDLRIRMAFQRAIDREAILRSPLYNGTGFTHSGILSKGLIGYNPDLPEIKYDPDEALRLMTEAGYGGGFEMEFTQMTESPNTLALNELVQAMVAELGITATINQMDSATWYDVRSRGELGTYTSSWSADFNDPDNYLYTFFTPRNTVNRSFNYKNEEAMARVEAARYMIDNDARIAEYQALEKLIIQDDAAWVPLFQLQHLWVIQPHVQNYVPLWNGWAGTLYAGVELTN